MCVYLEDSTLLHNISFCLWVRASRCVVWYTRCLCGLCFSLGCNKTGTVCATSRRGAFVQPLLQQRSIKYYIFWVCVCSLSYSACNVHVPYCVVICGLSRCRMVFHIVSYKARVSVKNSYVYNVFSFSLKLLSETISQYKKNRARYDQICILLLTLRRLMSYIYGAPILDVSISHTTTQHSR